MSAETIAYVRDWAILVRVFAASVTAIMLFMMSVRVYSRVSAILDSIRSTARNVRDIGTKLAGQAATLNSLIEFLPRRCRKTAAIRKATLERRLPVGGRHWGYRLGGE